MNPDLLTPAEDKEQNRYMIIVMAVWIAFFLGLLIGYNAHACGDVEEPEQIKITWIVP